MCTVELSGISALPSARLSSEMGFMNTLHAFAMPGAVIAPWNSRA